MKPLAVEYRKERKIGDETVSFGIQGLIEDGETYEDALKQVQQEVNNRLESENKKAVKNDKEYFKSALTGLLEALNSDEEIPAENLQYNENSENTTKDLVEESISEVVENVEN